ncbi:MAG: hypothetical protein ACRDVZ_16230, partial [Jiangellaceae bacterium]
MSALTEIARLPDVRRVELAWALSLTGGAVSTIALLVYCFDAGGATLVALYGVVRTAPAAVLTPFITSLTDHIRG